MVKGKKQGKSKSCRRMKTHKRRKFSKMKGLNYKRKSNKKVKRKNKKMKSKLIGGNLEIIVHAVKNNLNKEVRLISKGDHNTSGDWEPFKHGDIELYKKIIEKNPEFLRNLFALRMGIIVTASLQHHNNNILKILNGNIATFMNQASDLQYYLGELTFLKLQEKQNKTGAILTGMGHFGNLLSAENKTTALDLYSPSLKTSCTLIDFFLKVLENRSIPNDYRPGISATFYEGERGGTSVNTVRDIIKEFDDNIRSRTYRQDNNTVYLTGVIPDNLEEENYPNNLCTQANLTKGISHTIDAIQKEKIIGETHSVRPQYESVELERAKQDIQRARAGLDQRFIREGRGKSVSLEPSQQIQSQQLQSQQLQSQEPPSPTLSPALSPTLSRSSGISRTGSSMMADAVYSGLAEPADIPMDYFPYSIDTLNSQLGDTPCVALPPQPTNFRSVEYGGIFGASSGASSVGVPLVSGANIFNVPNSGVAWDFPCAGISGHTVEISLFFRLLLGDNYGSIDNIHKLNLTKYIIIACLNWMVSYVHHSFREICLAALIPLWDCEETFEEFVVLKNLILRLFEKQRDDTGYLDPNEFQKGKPVDADWYRNQEEAFKVIEGELDIPTDSGVLTTNYDSVYIKHLLMCDEGVDESLVNSVKEQILKNYTSWKKFIDSNRGPESKYAF